VVALDEAAGDRLLARRHFDGSVTGVFMLGAEIWVELQTRTARPLGSVEEDLVASSATPAVSPGLALSNEPLLPADAPPIPDLLPPPPIADTPLGTVQVAVSGRVLWSEGGQIVVDLGRDHGVVPGSHIELSVRADDESPLGKFERRDALAVGRVTSVMAEKSLVEVGIGETIPVDAQAIITTRPLTSSRSAPPRVAGIWTVAAVVRPFFVLEQLGFGALNEVSVGYQASGPLRYQLQLAPIGFASAGDGTTFTALAIGVVSYDTRLFEIGLGFGAQTVNYGDFDPGSGLTVAQTLRFGALDGLNLSIRNDVSLFHREFGYSAFTGQAQIPVAERGWLVLEGGGGSVGYAFFELGAKVLLSGNGTRGSVFLRGTVGYAVLDENLTSAELASASSDTTEIYYAGPLIGLGAEWRL